MSDLISASEAKIQKIEIGEQRADHEFLSALAQKANVDMNWLLAGDLTLGDRVAVGRSSFGFGEGAPQFSGASSPDYVAIPHLNRETGQLETEQFGHFTLSERWLVQKRGNSDNLAIAQVAGASMAPSLHHGDYVLLDLADTNMVDGVTYAFRLGDDLLIKRLQILPQKHVQLCSVDAQFEPLIVELSKGELQVIGRVIASLHEW